MEEKRAAMMAQLARMKADRQTLALRAADQAAGREGRR